MYGDGGGIDIQIRMVLYKIKDAADRLGPVRCLAGSGGSILDEDMTGSERWIPRWRGRASGAVRWLDCWFFENGKTSDRIAESEERILSPSKAVHQHHPPMVAAAGTACLNTPAV